MGLKDICKTLFVDLVKSCHPQIQRKQGGGDINLEFDDDEDENAENERYLS